MTMVKKAKVACCGSKMSIRLQNSLLKIGVFGNCLHTYKFDLEIFHCYPMLFPLILPRFTIKKEKEKKKVFLC
jgi:hypothetical protein